MKKYWYVVVLAVSLFLLGACVTDTTPPPPSYPSSVSDLEDVSESESLYVVTVLTDDDVQALIEDVIVYISPQASESTTYQDSTSTLKSMPRLMSEPTADATDAKGYYNGLMNVFRKQLKAKEKLRNMVSSSKGLVGETDLEVEITGKAKEDIINALNALIAPGVDVAIETPGTLVLDYRDFMYLRALAGGLLSIYDSEEPVYGWFADLDEISAIMDYIETGELPEDLTLEDLFNGEAIEDIGSFVESVDLTNPDIFQNSETWTELNILVTELADIAAPNDELNTADIFAEGILQIGGMDFLVDTLDFFVEIINWVYVFEVANTDANGWSNDGKTSLYEYAATLFGADSNENISIKTYLGEDIPVEDMLVEIINEVMPEEIIIEGMPIEITEWKFGSVDLLKGAKVADLLGELNEVLPTGELVRTTKASTSIQSEGSGEISIDVSGSSTVDFGALSSDGTLELLKNNVGVKSKIIDDLIAKEIWTIIAKIDPTPQEIGEIIGIILNNLTFIEKGDYSLSTSVDIDNSLSDEATIETEGVTIDQLIVEFTAFINAFIEELMQPL